MGIRSINFIRYVHPLCTNCVQVRKWFGQLYFEPAVGQGFDDVIQRARGGSDDGGSQSQVCVDHEVDAGLSESKEESGWLDKRTDRQTDIQKKTGKVDIGFLRFHRVIDLVRTLENL
jgi:hypothetical protein